MKLLIAIILTLTCSSTKAQVEVTTPTGGPFYIITADSTFYYSTEDSTLVISDSLATIKWLIDLAIEHMKAENKKQPKERLFSYPVAFLNYRKR